MKLPACAGNGTLATAQTFTALYASSFPPPEHILLRLVSVPSPSNNIH